MREFIFNTKTEIPDYSEDSLKISRNIQESIIGLPSMIIQNIFAEENF